MAPPKESNKAPITNPKEMKIYCLWIFQNNPPKGIQWIRRNADGQLVKFEKKCKNKIESSTKK